MVGSLMPCELLRRRVGRWENSQFVFSEVLTPVPHSYQPLASPNISSCGSHSASPTGMLPPTLSSVNCVQIATVCCWLVPSSLCCCVSIFFHSPYSLLSQGFLKGGKLDTVYHYQHLRPDWKMSFSAQIRIPVYLLVNVAWGPYLLWL